MLKCNVSSAGFPDKRQGVPVWLRVSGFPVAEVRVAGFTAVGSPVECTLTHLAASAWLPSQLHSSRPLSTFHHHTLSQSDM